MEPLWHILFFIQVHALFFTTDNLKNIYTVTTENQVVKYDSTGLLLHSYNNKSLGQPTSLDVSNPMKLLLYYKDFSTIVWLDNTLSEIAETQLSPIGIIQSPVACLSQDGNFWVYDEADQRLKKINSQLEVMHESPTMQSISDKPIQTFLMMEENQQLFVSDSSQGVFVFDQFGNFLNKIPVKRITYFQVENNQLIYKKNNQAHIYQLKTMEEYSIELPDSAMQLQIDSHRIYLMQKEQIVVYPY